MKKVISALVALFIFLGMGAIVDAKEINIENDDVRKMVNEIKIVKPKKLENIAYKYSYDTKIRYLKLKQNEFENKMIKAQEEFDKKSGDYKIFKDKSFDGTDIVIEAFDEADDNKVQPFVVLGGRDSRNWTKAYGKRKYTTKYTNYVAFSFCVVNRYTINEKGLTMTKVSTEGSYFDFGSYDVLENVIKDKYAPKVNHDIDSLVTFKYNGSIPGVPIIFSKRIEYKSYIKILSWDKKKKKMTVKQHAKYRLY